MRFTFVIFALFLALLSAGNSCAQQNFLPERFGNWQRASCADKPVRPTNLSPEAGERDFEACGFTSGKQSIGIWLGKYRDPSSAYEVYASLLRSSMQPSTVGRFTGVDGKGLLMLVGDFVVNVDRPRAVSTNELRELAADVAAHSNKTPLPPIREFLPREELENGTQRYALGPMAFRAAAEALGRPELGELADTVGFAAGAEAMFGRYKAAALVILIDYPTPQLAELHMRHLDTSMPEAAKRAGATIERKGSLLSLVMAPAMPGYAQKLRDAVNYETQVTWNEPSATATDPPWAIVLYRIFIGTGIFMGAAIVMGVAFGGVRVFVKRLLPGKVFDRPETMEVLQLGLSGKRIDPSDFY